MFRRLSLLCLTLLACRPGPSQSYQLILDGEDSAWRAKTSGWVLDRTGTRLGNYRFSAPGPGTGSALSVWDIDSIPEGTYAVEFYVDNGDYAQAAEYVVEHDGGVTTVTRSQNFVGTGWQSLGTFAFRNAGRITQTDRWTGAGTKVIADALRLTFQGTPALPTVNVIPPEVTIVVDDLGALNPNSSSSDTYQLFQAAPKFTYAVIPALTYSTAVLQKAQTLGIETILHQPLQYIDQPDLNPNDPTRLYIGMNDAQILSTLRTNLQSVSPYVKGVNNHQGSRFSQFPHGLQVLINELKAQNLYYLDSRTISDSYAYDITKQAGILAAERDLFVDGSTVQNTIDLVLSVARRARYSPNYNHVMICHQRTNTTPGLLQVLDDLQQMGVTLVPLQKNLHYIVESDSQPPGATVTRTGTWTATPDDMISHECSDGQAYTLSGAAAGSAQFTPNLPQAGRYRVFVGFTAGTNNMTAVKTTIHSLSGDQTFVLDQAASPNRWHYVGEASFAQGTAGYVRLDNSLATSPAQVLRADCVKFSYVGPPAASAEGWEMY